LAFPVGTAVLISTDHFVVDRQLWVAHGFGKIPEPEIGSYFDIPDLHFLLLFLPAFLEEIIFSRTASKAIHPKVRNVSRDILCRDGLGGISFLLRFFLYARYKSHGA